MKNIQLFFLLFAMLLPGIHSCRKEPQTLKNGKTNLLRQSNCQIEVSSVCGNTMLSFPSQAAYDYAYDCLFEEYETWNDNFDAQHANLNDEDLNDLIEATGWDEEQTLIDFENSQGLYSLRTKLRADELVWLATGTFDPLTDPNNHYVDDPVEQALLNDKGMIMIDGEIFIYREDGSIYRITNGDCNLALSVAADPASVSDPNVVVVAAAGNPDDNCKFKERNRKDTIWDSDPNKMFRWYLKFSKGATQSKACAKIVNFKRKSNTSDWRRFRTMCDVEVSGQARSLDNCTRVDSFSVGCPRVLFNQNYCARKKRIRRVGKSNLGRDAKIQRLDVAGYYEAGGTAIRRYLTW
ncbi:MAG: hypothetical protein MUC87_14920 [Bacteroidia bacterium]|jgi:hypothetical protein|nr:hypothetical protein [Bacteroidia bacterium]